MLEKLSHRTDNRSNPFADKHRKKVRTIFRYYVYRGTQLLRICITLKAYHSDVRCIDVGAFK